MVRRHSSTLLLLFVVLALGFGLSLSVPTRAALDPIAIACPNNQSVVLEGTGAPPNEALLTFLRGRAVGGGNSDARGNWRLPLKVNDRPGIYDVEVKVRVSRAVVGRFTCYVDLPLDITETPTTAAATVGPAASSPTQRPVGTATPTRTAGTATPGAPTPIRTSGTTDGTATSTATPTGTTGGAATGTSTVGTATPTRTTGTATAGTATSTPTSTTTTTAVASMSFSSIICRDPDFPNDSEYVELFNNSSQNINIAGWRLKNATRDGGEYVFPSYTIDIDIGVYIYLYSGIGEDDVDSGAFYWDRNDQVWQTGDKAELRDRSNRLIATYTVQADDCVVN